MAWAELLHGAMLGYRDESAVREFGEAFGLAILPIDAAVAERAARLQSDYAARAGSGEARRLKTPDALILATADLDDEIESVICGDDKWSKVRGVRSQIHVIRKRRR